MRALLHDYSTVAWAGNGNYIINPTSVADAQMTEAPDGSHTYTFTIHEDLVYSDGTPITADSTTPPMASIAVSTSLG